MENTRTCFRPPSLTEWRDVALPKEHGSWSLALEPLAFGLIAAPSAGGAWLALAVVGAFFARRPLRLLWRDASPERRTATRGVLVVCGALIFFSASAVVATNGVAWLVWLIPSVIAAAVFAGFDLRNAAREGAAEVAGAAAFSLLPAAMGILAGCGPWEAAALAVMMCGRAVPTVLTVRAALRAAKTGERDSAPALFSAVAAVAAGTAFVLAGHAGWAGPAALGVLAIRTFGMLVFPRPALRASTIGMIEAGLGLSFVVGVSLAWR